MGRFITLLFIGLIVSGAARADDCKLSYEEIFQMSKPEYATNAVWNSAYGQTTKQEKFVSAIALDNSHMLAVGESFVKEDDDHDLIVTDFDVHGRLIWDKVENIPSLSRVRALLPLKNGFLLLGEKHPKKGGAEVWIGFFDLNGKLLSSKAVKASKGSLSPRAIIALPKGEYLLAASAEERQGQGHYAVFYKLSAAGGVVSRTAFISGSDGEIASIVLNGPAHIIAGGYIRGDDGRKNGWLMGLNPDLSIAWQRQYPRGGAAQFNHVTTYGDSYLIATGESAPGGGGSPQAGWVMMARSDSGEIYWQRYYTGKLNYAARSSLIAKDGLISTLIDAWAPDKSEEQPAVRLLSINPRGVVQINDEYIFAAGVRANYMTLGAEGVRVILGSTNTSRKLEAANEKAGPATPGSEDQGLMRRSADAWIMAATVTNPYHDPCTVPKAAMP